MSAAVDAPTPAQVLARVTGPGSDRGFELSWTDASDTAGSTLWDVATTYRKKC